MRRCRVSRTLRLKIITKKVLDDINSQVVEVKPSFPYDPLGDKQRQERRSGYLIMSGLTYPYPEYYTGSKKLRDVKENIGCR